MNTVFDKAPRRANEDTMRVTLPGRIVDVEGENKVMIAIPMVVGPSVVSADALRLAVPHLSEGEFDELLDKLCLMARREIVRSHIRLA